MTAAEASDGHSASVAAGADMVVRVPTQESELRAIRRRVRSFVADGGASDDTIEDFELVASELASNVMQHSTAEAVTIAMRRTESAWEIDVHDADQLGSVDDTDVPAVGEIGGRGLIVVKAVMDSVELVEIDGLSVVRCTKLDH